MTGYQRHRWMSLHKDEHAMSNERLKGRQVTFLDAQTKVKKVVKQARA